jgi:hypothetical protein
VAAEGTGSQRFILFQVIQGRCAPPSWLNAGWAAARANHAQCYPLAHRGTLGLNTFSGHVAPGHWGVFSGATSDLQAIVLSQVPKSEGPGAPRFLCGEVGHPPFIGTDLVGVDKIVLDERIGLSPMHSFHGAGLWHRSLKYKRGRLGLAQLSLRKPALSANQLASQVLFPTY